MQLPQYIITVINRIKENGYEAYVVGGCVRDYLLGQCPNDFDVTTSALPEEIMKIFSDKKQITNGLKHGTVTVVIDYQPVEITTYRVDGDYQDHRHPENVTFTACLSDDLSRRDFTINAMAYSPDTGIIDIFGGAVDLKNGIIRAVGDPYKRFDEDGLRILRALRFASRYNFDIDKTTADAIHSLKHLLGSISAERIQVELCGILIGQCYNVLHNFSDVICEIIPEMTECIDFEQHSKYHDRTVYEHIITATSEAERDIVYRLTMLLHDIGKPACFFTEDGVGHFYGHSKVSREIAEKVLTRLKFSNKIRDEVLFLVEKHSITMNDTDQYVKKALMKYGEERFFKLLKVHIFDNLGKAQWCITENRHFEAIAQRARRHLENQPVLTAKSLAVNGRDIMALGYEGNEIGRMIDFLLDAVSDDLVENDKDSLIEYIRINGKKGN